MESKLSPRFLNDEDGYPIFELRIVKAEESYVQFDVRSVSAWEDFTKTPCRTVPYLTCTIKFDGCSHVFFGEQRDDGTHIGYTHLCGVETWQQHCKAMRWIYQVAVELLGKNYLGGTWNEST